MNNNQGFSKYLRVLLVDEDVGSLEILGNMLKECQVIKCNGGDEALLKLHEDKGFDMVITAVHMAKIDGFQLLRQIRGMDLHLPVVVFSNKDEAVDLIGNAIKQGACDFIIKPNRLSMVKLIWQHTFNDRRKSENSVQSKKQPILEKEGQGEGEGANSTKKQRFVWTPTLKNIFAEAVDHLGGCTKAVPKDIYNYMRQFPEVPSTINRQHISSHLQKYRKSCNCNKHEDRTNPVYPQPSSNNILYYGSSLPPLVGNGINNAPQIGQQQPMRFPNPGQSAYLERKSSCCDVQIAPLDASNIPNQLTLFSHLHQPSHGWVSKVNNSPIMNDATSSSAKRGFTEEMHVQNHVDRLMRQPQPALSTIAFRRINSAGASFNNPPSSFGLPLMQRASSFSHNPDLGLGSHNVTSGGSHNLMNQNGFAIKTECFRFGNCHDAIPQDIGSRSFSAPSSYGNPNQQYNRSNFENENHIGDAEVNEMIQSLLMDDNDLLQTVHDAPSQQHY